MLQEQTSVHGQLLTLLTYIHVGKARSHILGP